MASTTFNNYQPQVYVQESHVVRGSFESFGLHLMAQTHQARIRNSQRRWTHLTDIGRWFQHVWRRLKWTVNYSTSTNLSQTFSLKCSVWQVTARPMRRIHGPRTFETDWGVPMKRYCRLWCNDMSVSSDSSNINWTPGSQGAVWSSRMSFCSDDVMRSFAAWRLSESAPKIEKRRAHVSIEEHTWRTVRVNALRYK